SCSLFLLSFPTRRSSDLSSIFCGPIWVLGWVVGCAAGPRLPFLLCAAAGPAIRANISSALAKVAKRVDIVGIPCVPKVGSQSRRSEEHTSELQSPDHLVC